MINFQNSPYQVSPPGKIQPTPVLPASDSETQNQNLFAPERKEVDPLQKLADYQRTIALGRALQEGAGSGAVASPMEGVGRLAKTLAGSYIASKAKDKLKPDDAGGISKTDDPDLLSKLASIFSR